MAISRQRDSGFTLIELIVVLAIIALLITVALPRYQGSVENAKVVALRGNLRTLRESIDRYHDDKAKYPVQLQDLVEARYLKVIPVDPITDSASTWRPLESTETGESGIVDVHSGAKGKTPQGTAYSDL